MRIFDGEDLAVDAIHGDGSRVIITFTSYEKTGGATTGGWLGAVKRLGFPGLFFISRKNHWFNTPELSAAIDAANFWKCDYQTALLAGASMGAHAAIRLVNRLGGDVVAAVSPQFCVNPVLAPFERRFEKEAAAIADYDAPIGTEAVSCPVYVIFDGLDDTDRRHVELISEKMDCTRIDLPNSGHSSARALADLKLLDSVLSFSGDEAKNLALVRHIRGHFSKHAHRSAAVLANMAGRLPESERRAFLARLPSDIVGIRRSHALLDKLKSDM